MVMKVKNQLKEIRKLRNYSQSDLAIAVDVSDKSIRNVELDRNLPNLFTALRLAAYLGVSVEDIFSLETVNPNEGRDANESDISNHSR
jgi:putative transcriptional regulator